MTYQEYADKNNIPISKVIQAKNDWLCSEGYDGNGKEYSLLEWLDAFCARISKPKRNKKYEDKTPWQKGDDYPF